MAMSKSIAKVHINKLAAAQRQLRAAIRMFFAGEDELAIHTVASAAYHLLTDLKKERGQDEVGDYYLTSIFYAIRDYRRGTLPSYWADDPDAMKWIREIAGQLPIDTSTNIKNFSASVSSDVVRDFWQKRNKVANFLKHADRDAESLLALDEVDSLHLLLQAQSSLIDLKPDGLKAEGLVLLLYFSATSGMAEGLPPKLQEIATTLAVLAPSEQLEMCSALLRGNSLGL
jgi:hypothetical protein